MPNGGGGWGGVGSLELGTGAVGYACSPCRKLTGADKRQACHVSLLLTRRVGDGVGLQEKATAGAVAVAESTSGKAQALGRVVGTLCVLTARDGDARSGMLASWVSQAS